MEKQIYKNEFSNWDDVKSNFDIKLDEPEKVFAEYDQPPYEGSATVIFFDGENYNVVEGGHCSCFGLENQWEPTSHTVEEIEKMMEANYGFFKDNKEEITQWLKI